MNWKQYAVSFVLVSLAGTVLLYLCSAAYSTCFPFYDPCISDDAAHSRSGDEHRYQLLDHYDVAGLRPAKRQSATFASSLDWPHRTFSLAPPARGRRRFYSRISARAARISSATSGLIPCAVVVDSAAACRSSQHRSRLARRAASTSADIRASARCLMAAAK